MRRIWTGTIILAVACGLGCGSGGASKPHVAQDGGTGEDAGLQRPGEDAGEGDGMVEPRTEDAGGDAEAAAGESTVLGRIVDIHGRELGDIEVEIAGQKVRSDNRGIFRVSALAAGKHQVTVVDPGHSAAQTAIDVAEKQTAQVALRVAKLDTITLADAEAGGSFVKDDFEIRLPAKGLRTRSGEAVEGAVEARYVVVNTKDTIAAAPGGMLGQSDSGDVALESFGMIDVRFYQGEEPLALATDVEVDFPLGPNAFTQDQEVDMWSFSKEAGKWQREGKGRVDKASGHGRVLVKASHFSWWSVAQPVEEQTCVRGRFLSEAGEPIPHMQVSAAGVDHLTSLTTTTADDGSFCMGVKRGGTVHVSAFGNDGASYVTWDAADVAAGTSSASCDTGDCTELGPIAANALFPECEGNVTDDDNHVLLLASGNAALDDQLKAHLEDYGNQVTLGPQYVAFDETVSLAGYDVVYLQANANWNSGDMPELGQRNLVNWINCGGGLLTVEWTVWKIGSGQFQLLDSVYPTVPVTPYGSAVQATYIQVGDDPTVHHGLEAMFTFPTDNFAGTEIDLNARPGATIFYDSQDRVEGVVGWQFNLGRVASVSTCGGPNEIADPNYGRMVANLVDWLQNDPPNEPAVTGLPDGGVPGAAVPDPPDAAVDAATPDEIDASVGEPVNPDAAADADLGSGS